MVRCGYPSVGIFNQAWYYILKDHWDHKQRSLLRRDRWQGRYKHGRRPAYEELCGEGAGQDILTHYVGRMQTLAVLLAWFGSALFAHRQCCLLSWVIWNQVFLKSHVEVSSWGTVLTMSCGKMGCIECSLQENTDKRRQKRTWAKHGENRIQKENYLFQNKVV